MENPAAPSRSLKRNKLKAHFFIPLLFLVLSCGNNEVRTENNTADTIAENEGLPAPEPDLFPAVTAFYRQQDPGFDHSGYQLAGEQSGNGFLARPFNEKELQPFLPLLVFNKDSSRAIDMYSGSYVAVMKNGQTTFESGEPDTEVAIVDFGKKERTRIFYTGPSFTVQDVRWLGDSVVAIAGAMQVGDGQVQPQFNKIFLKDGRQEVYEFRDTVAANLGEYQDGRIKNKLEGHRRGKEL